MYRCIQYCQYCLFMFVCCGFSAVPNQPVSAPELKHPLVLFEVFGTPKPIQDTLEVLLETHFGGHVIYPFWAHNTVADTYIKRKTIQGFCLVVLAVRLCRIDLDGCWSLEIQNSEPEGSLATREGDCASISWDEVGSGQTFCPCSFSTQQPNAVCFSRGVSEPKTRGVTLSPVKGRPARLTAWKEGLGVVRRVRTKVRTLVFSHSHSWFYREDSMRAA